MKRIRFWCEITFAIRGYYTFRFNGSQWTNMCARDVWRHVSRDGVVAYAQVTCMTFSTSTRPENQMRSHFTHTLPSRRLDRLCVRQRFRLRLRVRARFPSAWSVEMKEQVLAYRAALLLLIEWICHMSNAKFIVLRIYDVGIAAYPVRTTDCTEVYRFYFVHFNTYRIGVEIKNKTANTKNSIELVTVVSRHVESHVHRRDVCVDTVAVIHFLDGK